MSKLVNLATRHTNRALLLTADSALALAMRIREIDGRAFSRPGRLGALLRKVGLAGGRMVHAWDDDGDETPPVPIEEALAYTPRWLGEAEDTGYCWSLKDGVALMNCDTPLVATGEEFCGIVYHGYDTLLKAFREASADERVKAIFLHLDCPGGVVDSGLITLSEFMRQARESAGGKPIWVFADMACSAAYWIAAQADRIIAPEFGYVGSIGAVMVHEDYSEALKEDGIAVTAFTYGEEKVDGAWWEKLTETARASYTADVTQCGERFVEEVVAGRSSFTREALIATRARVYMARHADPDRSGEALGFVDAVMGEEAAFAELVAHIQSAPHDKTTPAPATGSLAAQQPKDKPMATPAQKALAAAQARTAKLKADLEEAEKAEQDAASAAEGGEEDDDENDGEGDGETLPGDGEDDDKKDDKSEATKISGSAEAKAHPALALAAINSGQTFGQFKANVAAQAGAPKPKAQSKLDKVLAGSQRLGPDAAKPEGGAHSSAMAARAKALRDGKTGG